MASPASSWVGAIVYVAERGEGGVLISSLLITAVANFDQLPRRIAGSNCLLHGHIDKITYLVTVRDHRRGLRLCHVSAVGG